MKSECKCKHLFENKCKRSITSYKLTFIDIYCPPGICTSWERVWTLHRFRIYLQRLYSQSRTPGICTKTNGSRNSLFFPGCLGFGVVFSHPFRWYLSSGTTVFLRALQCGWRFKTLRHWGSKHIKHDTFSEIKKKHMASFDEASKRTLSLTSSNDSNLICILIAEVLSSFVLPVWSPLSTCRTYGTSDWIPRHVVIPLEELLQAMLCQVLLALVTLGLLGSVVGGTELQLTLLWFLL